MTRKDYVAIAAAIRRGAIEAKLEGGDRDSVRMAANSIAAEVSYVLAGDNPRFDKAKFMEACRQ